jgi:hypothetical protein
MEKYPAQNQFLLGVLRDVQSKFSPEASEFYQFCLLLLLKSLSATSRNDLGYQNWTQAWDAGLLQIREVEGLVSKEDDDRYSYLLSKLKSKLLDGVYKFGFMMDSAYVLEEDLEDDNLDIEGELL